MPLLCARCFSKRFPSKGVSKSPPCPRCLQAPAGGLSQRRNALNSLPSYRERKCRRTAKGTQQKAEGLQGDGANPPRGCLLTPSCCNEPVGHAAAWELVESLNESR